MRFKGRKIHVITSLVLCCILTAVYCWFFILQDDKQPPKIEMTSDLITVSVSAGQDVLKSGVTAIDDVDGDVTGNILVENISGLTDRHTATITYVAYDSAGNAAKASRTVQFTDYEPPRFGQENALVFASNTSPDVLSFMTAEDKFDGDISNRVKGTLLSDTTSLTYSGEHIIEFRVTNSMGDTRRITLPVDVYEPQDYNAKVELTDYMVYIKKEEEFKPEQYLKSIVSANTKYPLSQEEDPAVRLFIDRRVSPAVNPSAIIVNVTIKSDVDVNNPGVYSVVYTVDYDGRFQGFTRLNVVVEE